MSVYGPNVVTLQDMLARLDPNGMLAKVVEVLNLENQIVADMPWMEGNLKTGNQTTVRTSIPTIGTRQLNAGVLAQKSTSAQVVDTCCILEANSDIDKDVLAIQNNPQGYRLSEDLAFAEGFRQKVASLVFYGDTNTYPDTFNGLAVRYASMTGAAKGNSAYQIVSAGGASAVNTSAWLVNWSEQGVCGIYPQNTVAGLKVEDKGLIRLFDSNQYAYWGYSTNMQWKPGLAVKNFRGVSRVCNIASDLLTTYGSGSDSSADLIQKFIIAQNRIPEGLQGNLTWYVNELVYTWLQIQLLGKSTGTQVYVTRQELMGKAPQLYVNGIKVAKCDAILNTEATIS